MVPLEPSPAEMVSEILLRQKMRIAELEAATQWRPASEPPEKFKSGVLYSRNVEVQSATGKVYTTWYDYNLKDFADVSNTIRWRDLPPMPEVKS
jgi:hypothetical protein